MTDKPKRIQRKRTPGWKMPLNTVYVGRGRGAKWGNAAKIGEDLDYYMPGCTKATAQDAVDWFIIEMKAHKHADPEAFAAWLAPLRGKNLACWCRLDAPCHADVLLKLANEEAGE
jgi:hypothetical protein